MKIVRIKGTPWLGGDATKTYLLSKICRYTLQ